MLTLTSPVETWAHRWPAGIKLALLCAATVGLFSLSGIAALSGALAAALALIASGGRRFAGESLRMLRPLWPFVALVALWHLWLRDPGGVTILLRMTTAVLAANFVTMTTKLSDMLAVFETLARPLAALGLSPRLIGLAVALMIRFLPVMQQRSAQIGESWRARSARRAGWRVLVPATMAALDDADRVAEALRARGGAV